MANNRLHLYCTTCLEVCILGKYYPRDWYVHQQAEQYQTKIDEFFTKHSRTCHKGLDGEGMFGLRTENDDDEFITDYGVRPTRLIPKAHETGEPLI